MLESEFLKELELFEPIIKARSYKIDITGREPDDIQNEIRLKLWLGYPNFKGNSSFKTWANKVMGNCIIDLQRKSKTQKESCLNNASDLDDEIEKESLDF